MRIFFGVSTMKKVLSIILVFTIIILFSACMHPGMMERKPFNKPNSKWQSEDGTVVFYVGENGRYTGTMCINGEIIEVYLCHDTALGMHIFPISVLEAEAIDEAKKYEYWECLFISKEKFIATVKRTTFFEVGKKFTFHCVEP